MQRDGARIFVDGKLIGYFNDGENLVNTLRELRRTSKIHSHVGISLHQEDYADATKRLYINCNAGRVLRPLIIIKNGKSSLTPDILDKVLKNLLSWIDLVRMGIIELIDANEEENCFITFDDKHICLLYTSDAADE